MLKDDRDQENGPAKKRGVDQNSEGTGLSELLAERAEASRALEHWRASKAPEAPDRVAEFEELVSLLESEIDAMNRAQ